MTDEAQPNQQIAVRPVTPVTTGGQVAALVPQSIEEAYRLATAIDRSGMAPKSLDTVEKCLVAIMAGAELGLPPYQSVQAFAVINGRPTLWGDAFLAVLLSKGFVVEEWFDDPDAPTKAFCKITRPDTGQVIERRFSIDDAKTAKLWGKRGKEGQDTPWITYPPRMLQMRARAFAGRDGAADALKGFQMREEVDDYQEVREARPQVSDLRAKLEAQSGERTEGFTAENGENETPEEMLAEVELPIADTQRPTTAQPDAPPPTASAPVPTEAATPASEPTTAVEVGTEATGDDISAEAETLPLSDGSAKPAASAQGAQSAQTATDASSAPETASGGFSADPAFDLEIEEEADPVVEFINTVAKSATWHEAVASLGALMKLRPLEPHELRSARIALWHIPARVKDKVDPAAHPTNFMTWLAVADDDDQIVGTLDALKRSPSWDRLKPEQHQKILDSAAEARRRIEDRAAEMA